MPRNTLSLAETIPKAQARADECGHPRSTIEWMMAFRAAFAGLAAHMDRRQVDRVLASADRRIAEMEAMREAAQGEVNEPCP